MTAFVEGLPCSDCLTRGALRSSKVEGGALAAGACMTAVIEGQPSGRRGAGGRRGLGRGREAHRRVADGGGMAGESMAVGGLPIRGCPTTGGAADARCA
jgi:hypothetical protein